jgi:hypothetical protein
MLLTKPKGPGKREEALCYQHQAACVRKKKEGEKKKLKEAPCYQHQAACDEIRSDIRCAELRFR